jgi:hypothetical protein
MPEHPVGPCGGIAGEEMDAGHVAVGAGDRVVEHHGRRRTAEHVVRRRHRTVVPDVYTLLVNVHPKNDVVAVGIEVVEYAVRKERLRDHAYVGGVEAFQHHGVRAPSGIDGDPPPRDRPAATDFHDRDERDAGRERWFVHVVHELEAPPSARAWCVVANDTGHVGVVGECPKRRGAGRPARRAGRCCAGPRERGAVQHRVGALVGVPAVFERPVRHRPVGDRRPVQHRPERALALLQLAQLPGRGHVDHGQIGRGAPPRYEPVGLPLESGEPARPVDGQPHPNRGVAPDVRVPATARALARSHRSVLSTWKAQPAGWDFDVSSPRPIGTDETCCPSACRTYGR